VADHTITIANSLNVFGDDPPTRWGTSAHFVMTWGTDKWGYGSEDMQEEVGKFLEPGSVALTSAITQIEVVLILSNAITFSSALTLERLSDGSGWDYVLPGGTTNGVDQIATTYANGSSASTTYTTSSAPSTTWSDA
jgi:hypothetical protein